MPNSKTRPNSEVQAQRLATLRERYGASAVVAHRDISRQRFGHLVATKRVAAKGGRTTWAFLCDCGKRVERRLTHVTAGRTTSCGCAKRQQNRATFTTHGCASYGARSPAYISWCAMWARCGNPKHPHFSNYGGRGIAVCERWTSFEHFLADMGERTAGLSLDRFPDNDGDYEPGNCRWATRRQQRDNTRHSHG